MRLAVGLAVVFVLAPPLAVGLAIALGGPRLPPPMASIGDPFRRVDWSSLPPSVRYRARDGAVLAYRAYAPAAGAARGSAVLVHGSSARGASMHPLATALARAGFAAYALDVRGHGDSGPKGRIAYVGQLEDDLEDFVRDVSSPAPRALVGFSSGGGFALRFAGGARQDLFDRYVLLSPFLHQDAPTYRPGSGGWVRLGVPRIVGLALLNRIGVTRLNDLPVTAFALGEPERALLTPTYSYALAVNFRPHDDWQADVSGVRRPLDVLVGADDEVFRPDRFEAALAEAGRRVPVTIVPGASHVGLTLDRAGIEATVAAVTRLP